MKNKLPPHPPSNSGVRPPAGADSNAPDALALTVVTDTMVRLSIPTLEGLFAAHAKALDTVPTLTPDGKYAWVPLFDAATSLDRRIESYEAFSPAQHLRLEGVLSDAFANPAACKTTLVQRACAALNLFPVGDIAITANAVASAVPVEIIYLALLAHRRVPDERSGHRSRPPQNAFVVTWHSAPDDEWPPFVLVTDPDGRSTLVALRGEIPGLQPEPGCN